MRKIDSVSSGEQRQAMHDVIPQVPDLLRPPIPYLRVGDGAVVHALADHMGVRYRQNLPWHKLETYTLIAALAKPVVERMVEGEGSQARFRDTGKWFHVGSATQSTAMALADEYNWIGYIRQICNTKLSRYIHRQDPKRNKQEAFNDAMGNRVLEPHVHELLNLVVGRPKEGDTDLTMEMFVDLTQQRRRVMHNLATLITSRSGLNIRDIDRAMPLHFLDGYVEDNGTRKVFRSTSKFAWNSVFPSHKRAPTETLKCPFSQKENPRDESAVMTLTHAAINHLCDTGQAYEYSERQAVREMDQDLLRAQIAEREGYTPVPVTQGQRAF